MENNQIVAKRQVLQNAGPAIIETAVLTWDPSKNDYVRTTK